MLVNHHLREHADVRICSLVESHAAELYRRHGLDRDVMHEVVIALMAMMMVAVIVTPISPARLIGSS
jgi:hypothetical protein